MKIISIIVRFLLAFLFLFSASVYFFQWMPIPEMQGPIKVFNDGLEASDYLLPLIKITEVICALAFLSNRFVPLATVVVFPITLNIFLVHIFIAPEGIPVGIFIMACNLFLAYYHRNSYTALLAVK